MGGPTDPRMVGAIGMLAVNHHDAEQTHVHLQTKGTIRISRNLYHERCRLCCYVESKLSNASSYSRWITPSHPATQYASFVAILFLSVKHGQRKKKRSSRIVLVYLQGGPGFECAFPDLNGFVSQVHERGYQTLLLDQRGTGLSTAISSKTIPSTYRVSPQKTAEYLKHFRADSIVKDCEAIRKILLSSRLNSSPESIPPQSEDDQKWTIMGQSFGGFCALTYLSFAPEGLKEVFLTGGLAPLTDDPDLTYEASVLQLVKRNKIYYEKYPRDLQRIRNIFAHLESNNVLLPNGGRLTVKRFQQLGIDFGMVGGIDRVHQIVFRAANDLDMFDQLSYKTLQLIAERQSWDGNPLYAILHEPIYCQHRAAKWSASRIMKKYPQFDWDQVKSLTDMQPVYLTGEMIIPEMFDDYSELRPLKEAAELLAHDTDWSSLYNLEQLAKNEVKVSAATYYDDMYVPFELSQDTAERVANVEQFITNQLQHDGLRMDPKEVMNRLFALSKRERF